jgi:protein TonB
MPEFIGGIKEFSSFLKDNIIYPAWEKEQKIEGIVFVTFVVEKDGSISNLNAVRVPDGSKNLADEAIRVLSLMPKWIPGETEGENVRVSYTVPILFKIP